ncbi:MAG: hypothetical protein ACM32O_01585 [Clostridia bacterium]
MSRFEEIYPLFHEYDMFAQTIEVLKAPNVYKVMTPYGSFVCKRTPMKQGKIQFLGEVLRNLQQRGWEGAVPYFYTKFDEPFVARGEHLYYLSPWHAAVEDGTEREESAEEEQDWSKALINRLGELHHLTQNYRFDDPKQVEPLVTALATKWQLWLDQTEMFAVTAQKRTYPSPFDVVFLANHAFISERAQSAIQLLQEWQQKQRGHTHFRLSINHGFPHPAHLVSDRNGQLKLINFDRAQFDTPVRDLTLFYRTYFHMGGDEEGANLLLASYQEIFPLRPDEIGLLVSFMQYPERVMRDLDSYYYGKQKWNELYAVKRLEKDIDRLYRISSWSERAFTR